MDEAAKQGKLPFVRLLHLLSEAGCSSKAMDYAAARNHLKILAFLHARRTEGCTEKALNDASLVGHVRIVEFLLTHWPQICDADRGITLAKQRNYVDVIALLEKHKAEAAAL